MAGKEYSLREIKHARTKITIMKIFIAALEKARYDDISIRCICRDAEISEGTFFNYFPEKIDIIHFFIQAILLKAIWQSRQFVPERHKLVLIETVFENLAGSINNANIMYQLIAAMMDQRELPKRGGVAPIERELLFPGCTGIEGVRDSGMEEFLTDCLKGAVKNGEIPKNANIDDMVVSLVTILTGTLLATKFADKDNNNIVYHFKRQLAILWSGIGGTARRG